MADEKRPKKDSGAPAIPGGGMGGMGGMDYKIRCPQLKRRKPGTSSVLFSFIARRLPAAWSALPSEFENIPPRGGAASDPRSLEVQDARMR